MRFVAERLSVDTYVNIMDQYRPSFKASEIPEIARRPSRSEIGDAFDAARRAGLWRFA
jgi:putative pyruvate formate lyase activating enzyme